MRKFDDSVSLKLLKARDGVMSFFRPLLQEHGLTEQQWRILRALYEFDELEPNQLSQKCCILAPSMTGMINRLEQKGYVVRRRPMEDQRRTLIRMTKKARNLFVELSPEIDKQYRRMRKRLSPQLVDQLLELCSEVEERMKL